MLLVLASCSDGQASDSEYVTVSEMCEIVSLVHGDVQDVGGTAESAWRSAHGREYPMGLPPNVRGKPEPLVDRYDVVDELCGEYWKELRHPLDGR